MVYENKISFLRNVIKHKLIWEYEMKWCYWQDIFDPNTIVNLAEELGFSIMSMESLHIESFLTWVNSAFVCSSNHKDVGPFSDETPFPSLN